MARCVHDPVDHHDVDGVRQEWTLPLPEPVRFDPWDEHALAATMMAAYEALDERGLAFRILANHLTRLGVPQDLEPRTEIAQEPRR